MGRYLYKHVEDSEHGLLSLLHPWRIFGVGVHMASDRDWSVLQRETAEEGVLPVVKSRSGGGVYANTYSSTSHRWMGGSGATSAPNPWGVSNLSSFFPGSTHALQVPSGRMTGGGCQQHRWELLGN